MLKYILVGAALAFTAAVQPGPFQAYVLSRVASVGWRKTIPAAMAPVISDGPIAVLALLVLGQLSPTMQSVLRLAGACLLLFFAWRTFRQWRARNVSPTEIVHTAPRTLFEATLVNLLNPNPYIGWALILGPIVVSAWREAPSFGVAVVAAFYATIVMTQAALIYAFGTMRFLGAHWQRQLLLLSSVILAALALWQGTVGARGLVM